MLEKNVIIDKSINKLTFLNIIFLPWWSFGFLIDYYTGAMYKPLDGKTNIDVILERSGAETGYQARTNEAMGTLFIPIKNN